MESTSETTRATKSPIFPVESVGQDSTNQENSGIYEIQALAKSAKKRQSRRLTSQLDAQESLLASAAALDSIALPDPSKSTEIRVPSVGLSRSAELPSVAASSSTTLDAVVTMNPELKSSSKTWLFVGVGLAACAAAAFFMITNGDSKTSATTAKVAAAPAAVLDEVAQPVALPADTAEVAPLEMPVVAPLEEGSVEEEVNEAQEEETKIVEEVKAKPAKAEAKAKKPTRLSKRKSDEPKKVAVIASAKSKAKDKKKDKETPKAKPKKLSKGASIDDVLSSVTGGVDTPIVAREEAVKKPSKKRLERSDVAKAMKRISSAAKGCYSTEEFSGMVTVKYSVGPSGAITKASATGKHKSSKTGKCVVSAVRKAKFPPFDGATMSFSFPFLLAP